MMSPFQGFNCNLSVTSKKKFTRFGLNSNIDLQLNHNPKIGLQY